MKSTGFRLLDEGLKMLAAEQKWQREFEERQAWVREKRAREDLLDGFHYCPRPTTKLSQYKSRFAGLHDQVRVISIALAMFFVFVLDNGFKLDTFQLWCLVISICCTAILIFGTFASIHVLYIPAVYIMRFAVLQYMIYNTLLIGDVIAQLDTFSAESTLRTKKSTVHSLNQNFAILSRCFMLSVQTWICLLVFGCLQLIAKDYYRLRECHFYDTNIHRLRLRILSAQRLFHKTDQ